MSVKQEDIIKSVVSFLRKELHRDSLNSESKEGVEVAIECLCKAYDIAENQTEETCLNLEKLFETHIKDDVFLWFNSINFTPSLEAKNEAEKYKNLGNIAMQQDKADEAVVEYSKAIECDKSNPVYYCNRAASNNKLQNYKLAIRDCLIAIKIDPNYAKAYGRMGLAYTQMKDFKAALESYTKAAEIDPNDPLYANNMKAAMSNLNNSNNGVSGFGGGVQGGGGNTPFDMTDLSRKVLQDPTMQQLFGAIMNTGGNNSTGGGGNNSGLEAIFQASHQMAAQLEQNNPQIVEQILQQIGPVLNNVRPNNQNSNGTNNQNEENSENQ